MTAMTTTLPSITYCQKVETPMMFIEFEMIPRKITPRNVPKIEPRQPASAAPPTTEAAMVSRFVRLTSA